MRERYFTAIVKIEVILKTPDEGQVDIQYTGDHYSTEASEAVRGAVEKAAKKAISVNGLLDKEKEVKHG